MKDPQTAFTILLVLKDLMSGVVHSRHTIAGRARISLVTSDRWMRMLLMIPGCELSKNGRTTLIGWRSPQAKQEERK